MLPDALFLNVHMYGIMIAVGILATFAVMNIYCKKKKMDSKFVDFLFYDAVVSIMIAFGTATLFQSLYEYIQNPEKGFHLGTGMTFLGGLIGGLATFFIGYAIFRKKLTGRITDFLQILPCCITITHGFGRVGCFFAGCCYGIETDSFLGVKFPNLPNPVYPTQLFEAAFLFLLFAILSYMLLKKDFKYNLSLYLIAYGVFRFLIEFIRDDERGQFIGSITPSQFWSVVMVVAGVALIFLTRSFLKKKALAAASDEADEPDDSEEPETECEQAEPETAEEISVQTEEENNHE